MKLSQEVFMKLIAALALVGLLVVTAFSIFVWAASSGWNDLATVATAIVFMLISIGQGAFSFVWFKSVRADHEYVVSKECEDTNKNELTEGKLVIIAENEPLEVENVA